MSIHFLIQPSVKRTGEPIARPAMQSLYRLLYALMAALFTAVMVHYSLRHGRLVLFPTFDDDRYLNEGARLAHAYWLGGWKALTGEYIHRPPHSPGAALLAFASFLMFGIRDWAPYAANALLVLGFLLLADYVTRALPVWLRMVAGVLILLSPLAGMAVQEFRPDAGCSLLIVAGVLLIIEEPLIAAPIPRLLMAALSLGAAMLAKPPFFPAVLLIGGAALLASLLMSVSDIRGLFGDVTSLWRLCIRKALWVIVPGLVITLPHYLLDWREIVSYFGAVAFGAERELWAKHISLGDHLLYFLTGPGGSLMLGSTVYLNATMLGVAAVLILRAGDRRSIAYVVAVLFLLLLAWGIPTASKVKNPFFGLPFQILFMYAPLALLGRLPTSRHLMRWPPILISIAACVAVVFFQWPERHGDFNADWMVNRRQIVYGIYHDIRAGALTSRPHVYITSVGDVTPNLLEYLALKDGAVFDCDSNSKSADISLAHREFDRADFVIASDPGSALTANFLPSGAIQGQLLSDLRARRDFRLVHSYEYQPDHKNYYLFERVAYSAVVR